MKWILLLPNTCHISKQLKKCNLSSADPVCATELNVVVTKLADVLAPNKRS